MVAVSWFGKAAREKFSEETGFIFCSADTEPMLSANAVFAWRQVLFSLVWNESRINR
jgi:hypothetical protein